MQRLVFPRPANVNGDVLAADLGVHTDTVWLDGDDIVVETDLDEATVRAAVEAHDPPPPPPPPATIAEQIDALPDPTVDLDAFKAGLKAVLGAG